MDKLLSDELKALRFFARIMSPDPGKSQPLGVLASFQKEGRGLSQKRGPQQSKPITVKTDHLEYNQILSAARIYLFKYHVQAEE